jgi:hypothetical protein
MWSSEEIAGLRRLTMVASNPRRLLLYNLAAAFGSVAAVIDDKINATPCSLVQPTRMVWTLYFVSTLPVTLVLGRRVTPIWPIGMFLFGGISAGIVAKAIHDSMADSVCGSHNLFPIEIVMIAAYATPGTAAGMVLALALRRFGRDSHEATTPLS